MSTKLVSSLTGVDGAVVVLVEGGKYADEVAHLVGVLLLFSRGGFRWLLKRSTGLKTLD